MISNSGIQTVSWQIYYQHVQCDRMWRVRVATERYTLYPNQFPEDVPITQVSEYNVTINSDSTTCTDNVTISLLLTENVLQHMPYVVCIIRTGSGATSESHRSDQVDINAPSASSTTQIPDRETTTMMTQNSVNTNTMSTKEGNPFTLASSTDSTNSDTDSLIQPNRASALYRPHQSYELHLCVCLHTFTNIIHV